jgi:carbamoyl-phosphate synthase large subunit
MFALARAFYTEKEPAECLLPNEDIVECVHRISRIDKWFLHRMRAIIDVHRQLEDEHRTLLLDDIQPNTGRKLRQELLKEAKQLGFSDAQIAKLIERYEMVGSG